MFKYICQEENVCFHVQIMVLSHGFQVKRCPHLMSMLIIIIRDITVTCSDGYGRCIEVGKTVKKGCKCDLEISKCSLVPAKGANRHLSTEPFLVSYLVLPQLFTDESTPPLFTDESTPLLFTEESTQPLFTDESTPPLFTDESTRPMFTDESTPPLFTDESTPPLFTDESTRPLFDESTRPLFTDESTPPLFDESTPP
ncbi:uncharacterized protein LOC121379851, partial [Gigantopelta aegis]|uniref:uncharacterized protein LOC121379851 n=1 Tax=Gigantopelta aegis TaxID=1735272 RepID=UPI001B889C88